MRKSSFGVCRGARITLKHLRFSGHPKRDEQFISKIFSNSNCTKNSKCDVFCMHKSLNLFVLTNFFSTKLYQVTTPHNLAHTSLVGESKEGVWAAFNVFFSSPHHSRTYNVFYRCSRTETASVCYPGGFKIEVGRTKSGRGHHAHLQVEQE